MDTTTIIAIVVVAAVALALVALAWFFLRRKKTSDLEGRYGREYERTVRERGRSKAEAELAAREQRVAQYDIRPLNADERERFAERWTRVQAEFVDAPRTAVQHADVLLQEVMQARGYPIADFDQRAADLSVEFGDLVGNYRSAHSISQRADSANTEDLRKAMLQYRSLYDSMLNGAREEQRAPDLEEPADRRSVA